MGSTNKHIRKKCVCGHELYSHETLPAENGGWKIGYCNRLYPSKCTCTQFIHAGTETNMGAESTAPMLTTGAMPA